MYLAVYTLSRPGCSPMAWLLVQDHNNWRLSMSTSEIKPFRHWRRRLRRPGSSSSIVKASFSTELLDRAHLICEARKRLYEFKAVRVSCGILKDKLRIQRFLMAAIFRDVFFASEEWDKSPAQHHDQRHNGYCDETPDHSQTSA
jgi:hypothetical protein